MLLIIAAAINAWRLVRWVGGSTLPEPLLFILHVGYAWVVVGVTLLGLSILDAGVFGCLGHPRADGGGDSAP